MKVGEDKNGKCPWFNDVNNFKIEIAFQSV